jgi:hypothetical protein
VIKAVKAAHGESIEQIVTQKLREVLPHV